jgi:centractin
MLFPLLVCLGALSGRVWGFTTRSFFSIVSVGRPKHVRVMAGALEGDVFIGRKAQEFRGLLKIKYPMEHGIVTNWDDMERIWNWVYAEELGTLSEEVRSYIGSAELPASARSLTPRVLLGSLSSILCYSPRHH